MPSYMTLGLMSGTSLDGLDLCCVEFTGDVRTDTWSHRIVKTHSLAYDEHWAMSLSNAPNLSGRDLIKLHVEYGHFLGRTVKAFIDRYALDVQLVASHGHTIFHQPESDQFTFQLGDGESMVSYLDCPLVTNFRNKDVALGGQGAPLVPVGEKFLFGSYAMCMNLGGICNISVEEKGFDICPCNMLLNYLARSHDDNLEYDNDGDISASGDIIDTVLDNLNSLQYYQKAPPKSLAREWFADSLLPLLDLQSYSAKDLLRTSVEHIAHQISRTISKYRPHKDAGSPGKLSLLVTGGGAFNTFLMNRIRDKLSDIGVFVTETDRDLIAFKEALIFGFLGLRCMLGLANVSHGVTGSRCDSVSGSIHLPASACGYIRESEMWNVGVKQKECVSKTE